MIKLEGDMKRVRDCSILRLSEAKQQQHQQQLDHFSCFFVAIVASCNRARMAGWRPFSVCLAFCSWHCRRSIIIPITVAAADILLRHCRVGRSLRRDSGRDSGREGERGDAATKRPAKRFTTMGKEASSQKRRNEFRLLSWWCATSAADWANGSVIGKRNEKTL